MLRLLFGRAVYSVDEKYLPGWKAESTRESDILNILTARNSPCAIFQSESRSRELTFIFLWFRFNTRRRKRQSCTRHVNASVYSCQSRHARLEFIYFTALLHLHIPDKIFTIVFSLCPSPSHLPSYRSSLHIETNLNNKIVVKIFSLCPYIFIRRAITVSHISRPIKQ